MAKICNGDFFAFRNAAPDSDIALLEDDEEDEIEMDNYEDDEYERDLADIFGGE